MKEHGISNGELNFLMTSLGLLYLRRHGNSYNTITDVKKTLREAADEFSRRLLAPYEDTKIIQNGDVY